MILYGRNPVREALRGRRRVGRIWATEHAAREAWLWSSDAEQPPPSGEPSGAEGRPWQQVELELASAAEIEERCGSPEHQGVCAEAEPYRYADADELLRSTDALVLCLDELQDPHNLGAVCRVAEAAGCSGVVIPERRSVEVTPAVCKASAGAVEHLALARVRNLADWLAQAKRQQAWVYGADARATVAYETPDYGGRVVLVLGSEGRGLRPRVAASCDELVALPLRGRVGSLNVASAAAALVYGILHSRREA